MLASVSAACVAATGLVFLAAALAKATAGRDFADYLSSFGLRGGEARIAAGVVISLEVMSGAWLLSGWQQTLACGLAVCIATGFLAVQSAQLRRHSSRSCACFGAIDRREVPAVSFARAAAVLAIAIVAMAGVVSGDAVSTLATAAAGFSIALTLVLGAALTAAALDFENSRHRPLPAVAVDP